MRTPLLVWGLVLSMLANAGVLAQPPDAPPASGHVADVWASVQGLPPGTRLTLVFTDGSAVTARGVGKTIALETTSGTRIRGTIDYIEQDRVTVVHGLRSAAQPIAYSEVIDVRPGGMHPRDRMFLGVLLGIAIGIPLVLDMAVSAAS